VVTSKILVKNPGPKDWALGCPKGRGSRLRAQGKNNKRKFIFSLCLTPYAILFGPAKPLNSDPHKAGSWTGPEDQVF